jgi:hypothetical protein
LAQLIGGSVNPRRSDNVVPPGRHDLRVGYLRLLDVFALRFHILNPWLTSCRCKRYGDAQDNCNEFACIRSRLPFAPLLTNRQRPVGLASSHESFGCCDRQRPDSTRSRLGCPYRWEDPSGAARQPDSDSHNHATASKPSRLRSCPRICAATPAFTQMPPHLRRCPRVHADAPAFTRWEFHHHPTYAPR